MALLFGIAVSSRCLAQEIIILATGAEVNEYSVTAEGLSQTRQLIAPKDWVQIAWPSWEKQRNVIVFEGVRLIAGEPVGVYSIGFQEGGTLTEPTRLRSGRLPALSPNGELLATVDRQDRLEISRLDNPSVVLVHGPELDAYRPVAWIGNSSVLFSAKTRQLQRLFTATGTIETTGFRDLSPVASIGNSLEVVCVDYTGHEISAIDLAHGTSRVIKKYFGTSIGTGLMWDTSKGAVILSRQTWSKLLRLSDASDLFLLELDGSERRLMPDLTISGGFSVR